MKLFLKIAALVLAVALVTGGVLISRAQVLDKDFIPEEQTTAPDAPKPDHVHAPSDGRNMIDEPRWATCGNTECEMTAGGRTYRFMYSASCFFFDLLNNLDYAEAPCHCAAEFTVTPEFSRTYEVNLTLGFVRCEDGQCSLSDAQRDALEKVRDVVIEADGKVADWDKVPAEVFALFDF